MKSIIKKVTGMIFIAAFGVVLSALPVKADPGVTVTFDKETAEIGDEIAASIKIEGDTDGASAPDITVGYDPARLSFITADVEYGGGDGGLITIKDKEATISFSTLSGGDATVDITAILESETLNGSGTISVNGEDTATAAEVSIPETTTGVEAGTIQTDDGLTVSTVFADEFMPVLFHKATTQYKGQTAECAKYDMGDITLLYVLDETGAVGSFKMYDENTSELADFRMIQGIENRFIIVLPHVDESTIPGGFSKAVLEWNGQTLTAYMNPAALNAEEMNGVSPSDFFLIYAISSEGKTGWYLYDQKEGTYQRYCDYAIGSNPSTGASYQGNDNGSDSGKSHNGGLWFVIDKLGDAAPYIMIGLAALVVILIVIMIVLGVTRRMPEEEDYFEPQYRNSDNVNGYMQNYVSLDEPAGPAYRPRENAKNASDVKNASDAKNTSDAKQAADAKQGKEDIKQDSKEGNASVNESDKSEQGKDKAGEKEDPKTAAKKDKIRQEMFEKDMDIPEEAENAQADNYESMPYDNGGAYPMQPNDQMYMNGDYQDDYFAPRLSKKELKRQEKEARKAAKDGKKEDKWREKEEKKVAKRQAKGFEETKPIDWGNFEEHMKEMPEDDRRPRGNTTQMIMPIPEPEEELHTEDLLQKKEEIEAQLRAKKGNAAVAKQSEDLAKQGEELAKQSEEFAKGSLDATVPLPQSRTAARDQKTLEEEAKARAEYEQRQRAHEEQRRKAHEQMKAAEAKKRAEEEAKKRAAQEAQARADYEKRQRVLEEQKRALEEQRRAAQEARERAQYEQQMQQQHMQQVQQQQMQQQQMMQMQQQQMQQQQMQQRQQEEDIDEDFQFEFLKF